MRPRKTINQMNVVPYIDVMLVLLVIFMVTAPLITPSEIALPSIGEKNLRIPVDPLTVRISRTGALSVRGHEPGARPQTMNREQLIELIAANPERNVVIEADKNVVYERVVEVLAAAQSAGAKHAGLLVRPTAP